MNIEEIIRSRKSTYPKDFTGEPILDNELEQLLSVTAYAPNHRKTMPWRLIVFRNEPKMLLGKEMVRLYTELTPPEKFKDKKRNAILDKFALSDTVIAIVHQISEKVPEWEEYAAIAMAIQNMWLMCQQFNVGGYWSSPVSAKHLNHFLNLNPQQKCLGLFYLGKVSTTPEMKTIDWKAFVSYQT